MTFNISLEFEQQQRIDNDKVAVEARIDHETGIYAEGEFDGVIGDEPNKDMWSLLAYRSGYLAGLTRYYDKKYKVSISEPF